VVKAAAYRVVGEELEIELPGGGSYRVDLERVDRIVDDEVEVEPSAELREPQARKGSPTTSPTARSASLSSEAATTR
jgi:hypothetical protein